ncbi:glutamine--fructose-6-phosphate transaminase (isomerizing) [Haladaptatus sp. T7]|uniref:glutamine--fructose-6-phosphate transaminase (isomerizing) n=1 Tax=Haladaptatus sp. T7 TaxID=2029368 RepID=UPI0021A2542A|nr:glutamine--fructose-6-phosphate transaminase (isomerizing) [Haladaptatus sp. T7]GKZ14662.1 glutamine--fructose-6-phosphate aminotransferase [Haladaptatus sp. T7]
MCGITGYIGNENCSTIVAQCLKNLEYRGYDSAGIALLDDSLEVNKRSGEIDNLTVPSTSNATCGIGHTRWSTHGAPTERNAHPHTDCTERIAVVHNGIIDNYEEFKTDLLNEHQFTSETDTEVIAHLIEEALNEDGVDLREAVERVVSKLSGSFAIAVTAVGYDGIVAARQDSPLVIGHDDDATFLGSDVTAFVEHTRTVTFLEDGDIARLTEDGVTILNDGEVVEREPQTVDWDADAAEKGGYEHYMRKEIHEQPRAVRQALSGRIDELAGTVDLDLSLSEEYCRSLDEIQIVACGTSYYAGLYAAGLLEEYADVRVSVHIASEYEFKGNRDPWRTLVVAVTQSGETADTLRALRKAAGSGARTLAVTNTVGSTVTREVDDTVYIRAGPEIGVAASKTFVSQVATLTLVTVYLGQQRDALSSNERASILEELSAVPSAIQQVLDAEPTVQREAKAFADSESFFFIGRRLGHPVALEGALKLKEISYEHAEGFAGGELKHGPLALVTEDTPVIAVLTDETNASETLHNVKEVESRGAPVIGVTSDDDPNAVFDTTFDVPSIGLMEPVVGNVYLQLFAYHVAKEKGRDIDKPRNLAKSVTVE